MKRNLLGGAAATLALIGAAQAQAQAPAPSTNAMVNLVRALVAKGTLSATEGEALIAQSQAEAARAQAALGSPVPAGAVRVPYVPESVRAQIRDELRGEVMQAAREEGWARPGGDRTVSTTNPITLFGDFRIRANYNYFGRGNVSDLIDFNVFNRLGPTELNPSQLGTFAPPIQNTTRDINNNLNFRLRFGLQARVTDQVTAVFRLGTGNNDSPVSENQILGGEFDKKNIWLDQAYVDIHPRDWVSVVLGRAKNPFYSTEVIWDPDLNFDGIYATLDSRERFGKLGLQAIGGAFPVQFGDPDFPLRQTNQTRKARQENRWLYAAQLNANYRVVKDLGVKFGTAFYYYQNLQGRPSSPCQTFLVGTECDTDPLRPIFLQKGNTLFALRNVVGPPGQADFSQPQFVGLTFDYRILDIGTDVTWRFDSKNVVIVGGDYLRNLGLKRRNVCKTFAGFQGAPATSRPPINNIDDGAPACAGPGPNAGFNGGGTAWEVRALVGRPDPRTFTDWRLGDWSVLAKYKYIESDAVLDAFNDSDFALGGTNAQGFVVQGTMGLYRGLAARARYLSTNEIAGPPLAIDVLQLDLLVSF